MKDNHLSHLRTKRSNGAVVIKEYLWHYFDILWVNFCIYKFKRFEAVQNFKCGIKNHQVSNVECVKKNVPNIASEPRGSEVVWGFSAMPQIKTKHKHNFKQNLQSLSFSSPNFDFKKKKKYYANVKDTIGRLACLNNQISPVLSRNWRLKMKDPSRKTVWGRFGSPLGTRTAANR